MTHRKIVNLGLAKREDISHLVTRIPPAHFSGPSPFLIIVHHGPQVFEPDNCGLPFVPHPHCGFETVTFIRSGALLHEDSRSPAKTVHAGGVQWMTAGSGVVHNESATPEFRREGGLLEVLQLWLNLPSRLKGSAPKYHGVEADEMPEISSDDGRATVHLIAGQFAAQVGPIESLTGATMLSADFREGGTVLLPAPAARDVFLYVVAGDIVVDGTPVGPHTRVEFDQSGDHVTVTAASDASIIYGHAPMIEEPVIAHGPFVMTTSDEIVQAVRDYQAGHFA